LLLEEARMRRGKMLLGLAWCICLTGCASLVIFAAGTASGVGGYMYYMGALRVTYQAPYMQTWDATSTALENLGFSIESKAHDLTKGDIVARRAAKTPIYVDVSYISAQETEVSIRVGLLGDESASMAIKEEIRKVLFKK
jgi:uncharacterized lipoprotein